MASSALNSGWILDERFDGLGGFLTNCSPTSSGLTFISTGDATGFYIIGRALRVIQAAGTAICTVGQSSFAAGITTIYLNQFSTQSGLSTVASTGAITSVAASPIVVGTTNHNTFSGGITVTPSTNTGSVFDFGAGSAASFGTSPSTAGVIRIPNTQYIFARNQANTGNIQIVGANGENPQLGALANVVNIAAGGGIVAQIGLTYMALGATPGSSGLFRLANSAIAIVGKTSTGGDDVIWPHQYSSTTLTAGDIATSGTNFTTIITKTLAVGTWHITAGMTINSTAGGVTYAVAKITDGTNDLVSSYLTQTGSLIGASTTAGITIPLSVIVSHTTALAYNLQLASDSTAVKAKAIVPGPLGTTGATWFTAVKIG
jgi:hypothetical protein